MRNDRFIKVAIGAMLHDIGKVLYRADDGRNHSLSGYEFLKEEVGLTDPDILDQVRYHHAALLKAAQIPVDSLAYITYMADNIAAAADRRQKMDGDTGFDRHVALESVFNILNGNEGKSHYAPMTLDRQEKLQHPFEKPITFDEVFYKKIRLHMREALQAITENKQIRDDYVNSLLNVIEANLSFIPSSTDKSQLGDISLYDHVKLTAAIGACIYAWAQERELSDYKSVLFEKASEFYENKVFRLCSLDISGIQAFIYQQYGTKDVLKNLRARSFYLEIMLENLVDGLLDGLQLSRANLIYSGGGHAYLLLPNTSQAEGSLQRFVMTTNEWLLDTFSNELFIAAGSVPCSARELENEPRGSYSELFKKVSHDISKEKKHRYTADQIRALNDNRHVDHERECRICHRSDLLTEDDICQICDGLNRLSGAVMKADFYAISKTFEPGRLPVFKDEYLVPADEGMLKKLMTEDPGYIRSYSKNDMFTGQAYSTKLWVADYSSAQTLNELVDNGQGIRRLGVIRADVDNLGSAFVSGFPETYQTLSRSAAFSRLLSLFFKRHINDILTRASFSIDGSAEKRHATIVYAGGDDLFIVGPWKDIIEFSVDLYQEFAAFSETSLTLSAGIGLFDEKYPISFIARQTEALENRAKHMDGKNAVTLFTTGVTIGKAREDHTYHWSTFIESVIGEKLELLQQFFSYPGQEQERGKAFLYRILNLLRQSEEKINLARLAYLLARMSPGPDVSEDYKACYNEFAHKLYDWQRNSIDKQQLITAISIYSYMIRDREG